jgi:hypothetical protein
VVHLDQQRIELRNKVEREMFDWSVLVKHYHEAHKLTLERIGAPKPASSRSVWSNSQRLQRSQRSQRVDPQMTLSAATVFFTLAVAAFLCGFITEWRQNRSTRPDAIVPTLPWALAAAIFALFGMFWLRADIPWWVYPLALTGCVLLFGWGITKAGQVAKARRHEGARRTRSSEQR